VIPKTGNTFIGEAGAILNGSMILTGWTVSGATWWVGGQTQAGKWAGWPLPPNPDVCAGGNPRCDNPEDLWIDNVLKTHVASLGAVGAGKWFFDYAADRIYVGDNPTAKTVETSVTPYAFSSSSATNVTIQGLIVEKYASPIQDGAIGGPSLGAGIGWIVRNNETRSNHAMGIRGSPGMQAIGNKTHHNGMFGLGGQFTLVQDNEIAYNNTAGVNPNWGAGGAKFAFSNGLVVRSNFVHHNYGTGLWTDIDNVNTLYENNLVEDNDLIGIFHEISYSAVVRNNVIRRNGASRPAAYSQGMGILVSASSDVEIYGNTVEDNWSGGIFGINPERGSGTLGTYVLKNLWVHDNTVRVIRQWAAGIGMETGSEGSDVFYQLNNRWNRNTYRVPAAITKPFYWDMPPHTWAQWRAFGHDLNGSITILP
jgi:hypothetical protein